MSTMEMVAAAVVVSYLFTILHQLSHKLDRILEQLEKRP